MSTALRQELDTLRGLLNQAKLDLNNAQSLSQKEIDNIPVDKLKTFLAKQAEARTKIPQIESTVASLERRVTSKKAELEQSQSQLNGKFRVMTEDFDQSLAEFRATASEAAALATKYREKLFQTIYLFRRLQEKEIALKQQCQESQQKPPALPNLLSTEYFQRGFNAPHQTLTANYQGSEFCIKADGYNAWAEEKQELGSIPKPVA